MEINKAGVQLLACGTANTPVILESNVKFDETYMKMSKISKYRVSIFFTCYCKLYCTEVKRHKCHFNAFSPSIHWDSYPWKKRVFFKITWQILSNLTKSVWNCQRPILWRNDQNWSFSSRNFFFKYEPCIKDKKLHEKEQKIYTNFFYFYVLKELAPKIFS